MGDFVMWPTRDVAIGEYARLLREGEWFAQANYGDGEWGCLLGHKGRNVNGEVYEPQLGAALRRTLLEPTGHWCGTNPGRLLAEEAAQWVNTHSPAVQWVEKETLPEASIHERLGPFLAALRRRRVVVVGPAHLKAMPPTVLGTFTHLPIPFAVAWREAERTAERVRAAASPQAVVLFASGMATNLVVHQLCPWAREKGVTLLDVGALLDPYAGILSRKAYTRPAFQQAIGRNICPENTAP